MGRSFGGGDFGWLLRVRITCGVSMSLITAGMRGKKEERRKGRRRHWGCGAARAPFRPGRPGPTHTGQLFFIGQSGCPIKIVNHALFQHRDRAAGLVQSQVDNRSRAGIKSQFGRRINDVFWGCPLPTHRAALGSLI